MLLTRMLQRIFRGGQSTAGSPSTGLSPYGTHLGENTSVLPALTTPAADEVFSFFSPTFWSTSDPAKVTASARDIVGVAAAGHHFADNLLTWGRNMSMLDDVPFVKAWKSNIESASDEAIVWRRYVLACAAYHCAIGWRLR